MESQIAFLPLTKKEIIFLGSVMRFHKGCDASNNIMVKIESLKKRIEYKFTPEYIIEFICKSCNITIDEIRSSSRERKFTEPRVCASALIKDFHPKMSLNKIGLYVGKDHTTVMSHIRNVREIKEYKELYNKLKLKITQE